MISYAVGALYALTLLLFLTFCLKKATLLWREDRNAPDVRELDKPAGSFQSHHSPSSFHSRFLSSEPTCLPIDAKVYPQTQRSDAGFWLATAGRALACLLTRAEYSASSQQSHLRFFRDFVAPLLGAAPAVSQKRSLQWKSFMTDDGTPIELSWDWGVAGDAPKIRYSIEPIGMHAGTHADPFNRYAGFDLIHRLKASIPSVNLELFHHFANDFITFDTAHTEGHQSRFFSAFDLDPSGGVVAKAYFFPSFKALSKDPQARLQVVADSLKRIPAHLGVNFGGFEVLRTYVEQPSDNGPMQVEIIAIDCIQPSQSRLKIYTRYYNTSFQSVRAVMTLGGLLSSPSLSKGLEELRELWVLLFGERPDSQELDSVNHLTAGLLYYFEIPPNGAPPVPRIYIPVRHYAGSETAVINALQAFLQRRRGDIAYFDVERYRQALGEIFSAKTLDERAGIQTYLACAIKKGSLRITSYFNPQCARMGSS